MTRQPKRNLLYWFPILLPILTGITMVSANGIVELIASQLEGEMQKEAVPVQYKEYFSQVGTISGHRKASLHLSADRDNGAWSPPSPSDASQSHVAGRQRVEKTAETRSGADQGHGGDKITPTTIENIEKISPVLAIIWLEINEAIIIDIFAAYFHFLILFSPDASVRISGPDAQNAFLWGIVGLALHIPFIISIPGLHRLYRMSDWMHYLTWASGLTICSFLIIFSMREFVWRKWERRPPVSVSHS